ncbi:YopX family protein [Levilactobacillus brevis]|uniref:YopX family protein n=1 Tax=Levilactobacillus brevis TaxID=1580 RepID=UPI00131F2AFD|nr:YopX family protein [Levilactobacillus brevis]
MFRAYIKDTDDLDYNDVPHKGHFVYGNLIEGGNQSNTDAIVGDLIEATDEYVNPEWWCSIEKGLVEQSTGLKDSNGKEIYECDIVRMQRPGFHEYACYEVKYFIQDVCIFQIVKVTDGSTLFESPSNGHDVEIIGNVHENPELLEAQHDTRTD